MTWLKAGILEDGVVTVADSGTGQGAVISPLLGNVLDLWAERWRRQEARGDVIIVRYADDLVAGFEHDDDASRFLDAMRERGQHKCKKKMLPFHLPEEMSQKTDYPRHAAA
jgi:RNA-directed DNA polymerase